MSTSDKKFFKPCAPQCWAECYDPHTRSGVCAASIDWCKVQRDIAREKLHWMYALTILVLAIMSIIGYEVIL